MIFRFLFVLEAPSPESKQLHGGRRKRKRSSGPRAVERTWSYGRVNSLLCGACAVSQGHIWVHSLIAARA